jgi:hypothetical protein
MVMNLRSVGAAAAIWLAAVGGVSATAWFAIDRAGRDITDGSAKALPSSPLSTPMLDSQTAGSSPRPTASAKPSAIQKRTAAPTPAATATAPPATVTPTPPSPAAAAASTPQDRTISVNGGLVSVRCTGAAIQLRIAQPEYNWHVYVDTSSPQQINVSFQTGEEENRSRTQVSAVCTNGSPALTVTNG